MQTKKDTHIDNEGGDVELANNNDLAKYNSDATLSSGFPQKRVGENESSSSKVKNCLIGITIVGCLIIVIIIIAVAGGSGVSIIPKNVECPSYHYKDPNDSSNCIRSTCDFRSEIMVGQ